MNRFVGPCLHSLASLPAGARCFVSQFVRRSVVLLVAAALLVLPGCSGCQKDPLTAKKEKEEEEKKKKKSKEKDLPNFEVARLVTNPDDPEESQNYVKPGHWITLTQQARANNFDYRAELELITVDSQGNRFDVDRTPYQIASSRPAALAKGQSRHLELTAYVPAATRSDTPGAGRKKVWFQSRLLSGLGGTPLMEPPTEGTAELKEYECFLLVLAREHRNYLYLKTIDSARMPTNDADLQFVSHYRVIVPRIDERVPLPENSLTWTGIAHMVWDKVNPKLLSPSQQQALLDWLHWGGNLIISSPESLEMLRGSFLEPYLAATSEETVDLDNEAIRELNEFWSLPDKKQETRKIEVLAGQPILAVKLKKHELAEDVRGTGGLVVERRVGGGRIVQTAFALDDRYFLRWKHFDGFFNGALLRRPSRDFSPLADVGNLEAKPLWVLSIPQASDDPAAPDSTLRLAITNPMLTSTLRYFSRDVGYRNTSVEADVRRQIEDAVHGNDAIRQRVGMPIQPTGIPQMKAPASSAAIPTPVPPKPVAPNSGAAPSSSADEATGTATPGTVAQDASSADGDNGSPSSKDNRPPPTDVLVDHRLETKDWRFGGYSAATLSGVAGWNDFSGAAHDVRLAIQEAAGIKIPSRSFVLRMMGIYLAVLVPLNWLIFRLLGRVEWAWVATPVIAIVGMIVVIQQAQLDIGFLRSRREVAILETQADYPRGHLTRYSLLYTYLGTGYDITLADPNTLAQPFAKDTKYTRGSYEGARPVHYRRDSDLRLRNFFVPSYSSEMVHTEQMFDLGGTLRLDGDGPSDWELVNGSQWKLRGAAVLYCPQDGKPGQVQTAWIGDVRAGVTLPLRFGEAQSQSALKIREWDESPVTTTSERPMDGEVRLTGLMALASKRLLLFPGDARLVGWIEEELPGIDVSPTAAQTTTRTMIIGHLRRGNLPPAARDVNIRTDYREPTAVSEDPASATSPPPAVNRF